VTTALRRGEIGTADARSDATPKPARRAPARGSNSGWPRLPVTWPLVTLFVLFPLWWVLGLSAVIWTIVAAPMLVALIWRRRTKAPASMPLWILFSVWVLMCGLQLESGTKIITFTYRLTLYVCGGILFLYVYNLPRSRRFDVKVLRILTIFWMVVVVGGYAGLIFGTHSFTSAIEYVLPHHLRNQPFVAELVNPVFANVANFLGFPAPRPSAPFPYTNNWGGNIAVLTPVAFAALSATRAGLRRRVIIIFLVASLVPMVVSLNRGMFLSLGVGLVYVAIRLAGRGRLGALMALLGFLIVVTGIVALTPLSHFVVSNLSSAHGHSNTTRISVAQQSFEGANKSPFFGFGEPQAVTGQGGTPPIGSQGQLWMLLYSDGYIATALFIGFYLVVLWQTRRASGTIGLWLHAVPLIALAQITVYGWLPAELQVVMVVAALAYRRCWTPDRPRSVSGVPQSLPRRRRMGRIERKSGQAGDLAGVHEPGVSGGRATDRALPAEPGGAGNEGPAHRPGDRDLVGSGARTGRLTSAPFAHTSLGEWSRRPWRPYVPPASPLPAASGPSGTAAAGRNGGLSAASKVVVRGSLINLFAMVAGAAMSFGMVVLVSRWLQPRGAGAFFELIALFTILSNTFELGADTGLTRWISRARAIGGLADTERIVAVAVIPVMLAGTAAAVALWFNAAEVARIFLHGIPQGAGATDIRYIAPLIPIGSLSALVVDGVRGFGRMWPYLVIEGLGKPAVRLALVVTVLAAGLGLHAAILVWGLPVIAGLMLGTVAFLRVMRKEVAAGLRRAKAVPARQPAPGPAEKAMRPKRTSEPDSAWRRERARFPAIPELDATVEMPVVFDPVSPPDRHADNGGRGDGGRHRSGGMLSARGRQLAAEFWSFTGPRAFQATFQVTILWLDILIVGALVNSYQAGIYSAVSKLAILGTFALEGNRLAIGPQLSAMLARKEHSRAADLYQTATRTLILATWPLYLVLAIFPAVILGIFGPKYAAGGPALTVLALAMLVNLGTGNVTVVLLMGGKSSWGALNAGAALAANIGLNLVLVPRYGILGAAIAWAVSIIIDNVTAMIEIRWVMGLAPFGPGYWLAAGITLACFGITGAAARMVLGQTMPALAVALAAGLACYGLALVIASKPLHLRGLVSAFRPGGAGSRPMRASPQTK
jgi:polysaccharide biosynthesis protein PslJ